LREILLPTSPHGEAVQGQTLLLVILVQAAVVLTWLELLGTPTILITTLVILVDLTPVIRHVKVEEEVPVRPPELGLRLLTPTMVEVVYSASCLALPRSLLTAPPTEAIIGAVVVVVVVITMERSVAVLVVVVVVQQEQEARVHCTRVCRVLPITVEMAEPIPVVVVEAAIVHQLGLVALVGQAS
jgi:hypothetical protein